MYIIITNAQTCICWLSKNELTEFSPQQGFHKIEGCATNEMLKILWYRYYDVM